MPITRRPRIGLALGAGGVLGGAWLAGGLAAIQRTTGWVPGSADFIIGTSAGSLFAALTAAGVPPARLMPESEEAIEDLAGSPDDSYVLSELSGESAYQVRHGIPIPLPGSLALVRQGLRAGTPLKALSGLAPQGLVSTEPIENTVRRVVPYGWAEHPNCWVVACDYVTGERVVFGREDAPTGHLADAVAASCAIPGFFKPVRIAGRLYVDGGLISMSNLDVVIGRGIDLLIVLNPLSSRHSLGGWNPMSRVAGAVRRLASQQLDGEVEMLLEDGTDVVVIEPTLGDLAAMGHNVMDARRSHKVAAVALRTVSAQLEQPEVQDLLAALPVERLTAPRQAGGRVAKKPGFPAAAAI